MCIAIYLVDVLGGQDPIVLPAALEWCSLGEMTFCADEGLTQDARRTFSGIKMKATNGEIIGKDEICQFLSTT